MLIEIIILLLAVPARFLIAWMARDELVDGRKWFAALAVVSFILGALFFILGKNEIGLSLAFILVVSLISYWKSFDKKWVKNRR
jgi:drug/metabolite transporter (DMT)-like permease